MKKNLALLSVFFLVTTIHAHRQVFSRSFMFPKPAYYSVVAQEALWHGIVYNKKGPLLAGIQAIPFFQRSTSLKKTDRYFLIGGKNELLVSGDANLQDRETRNVRAEWLNLPANFQGTLSINPKQQQYGVTLEYHQDLKHWFDVIFLRDMYVAIIAPIVTVHNNLHLMQANIANPSPTIPQNIIQAFNQPTWMYGKIDGGKRKTNLAEIKFLLGYSYVSEDNFQLNYNSILVLPVGKKQDPEFLFSPVVGNNHHMGVGAGVNFQIPLNRNQSSYCCSFILDLESVILIRNIQHRTFDLRFKQWSRFLQMNVIGAAPNVNVPGVNLLTRRATIKPFNMVDFAMGWRFKTELFEFQTGWGIWGHGFERVEHLKDIDTPFGIAGDAPGTTASRSTISQQAPNDPYFVPITIADIDPHSGSNAGALDFRVFMSSGIIRKGEIRDSVFGAGWSIDLPYKNSALQVWNFWFKLGATF